jgi:hypothetical protein
MSWITLRLAGVGEARREVVLEGLWGATRVGEVKRLAGVLLGGVQPALLFESRLLRDEETLAEAGVGAQGGVEACVGGGCCRIGRREGSGRTFWRVLGICRCGCRCITG